MWAAAARRGRRRGQPRAGRCADAAIGRAERRPRASLCGSSSGPPPWRQGTCNSAPSFIARPSSWQPLQQLLLLLPAVALHPTEDAPLPRRSTPAVCGSSWMRCFRGHCPSCLPTAPISRRALCMRRPQQRRRRWAVSATTRWPTSAAGAPGTAARPPTRMCGARGGTFHKRHRPRTAAHCVRITASVPLGPGTGRRAICTATAVRSMGPGLTLALPVAVTAYDEQVLGSTVNRSLLPAEC